MNKYTDRLAALVRNEETMENFLVVAKELKASHGFASADTLRLAIEFLHANLEDAQEAATFEDVNPRRTS